MSCLVTFILQLLYHVHFSGPMNRLQSIPLSQKASTNFGKSLDSIILNPVELPLQCLSSVFWKSTAHPIGAPSINALHAITIFWERRVKCSTTSSSKCCIHIIKLQSTLTKQDNFNDLIKVWFYAISSQRLQRNTIFIQYDPKEKIILPKQLSYLRWLVEYVQHGLASHEEGIFIIAYWVFLSLSSSHLLIISSFIEIWLVVKHKGLKGEKNLKNGGAPWIPNFSARTRPCVKKTETDLSRLIQIRVDTETTRSVVHQLHKILRLTY